MTSEFTKSELGTKAAWKGFSSQTSYIAYRLMILKDESVFYPEQADDLMIKKGDIPQELLQVKNLTADLALSHLSPQKSDSFFRRCLSYKSENDKLILTLEALAMSYKNATIMVVEYIDNNCLNSELADNLCSVLYDSWQLYAGVLQALLWDSVRSFYYNNSSIITAGDALYNGAFALLGLGDVTGYFKQIDMSVFSEILSSYR